MREEAGHEVTTEDEYLPTTVEEFLEYHDEAIKRIAYGKWKRQGFCDAEDIAQSIRLHVLEKWTHYLGKNEEEACNAFGKAANQYLGQESLDYMHFTGSFIYTPGMVRRHLEQSTWSLIEEAPDLEARMDLRVAYEELSPARKREVFRRFGLKIAAEDSTPLEQRNCNRGIDAITHHLNKRQSPRSYSMDDLRAKLAL